MGNSQKALDEQVIKAYHFIQSFAPTDEVTPEEAHQIGMDFMKKTFDDRYAFLCSTHVDKNHIHNHFVMCSASRDILGRKLDDNLSLLLSLRKNNDMRFEQISLEVKEKYGIAYSDIKGHISSLRADNNRLSTQITKSKKDLEELRSFVENCVAYKRYKIHSINEEKASDKEKYYEAHDSQLDAFHDAVFALERRNIDLDSITYEGIKIMQQKVTEAETEIKRQEDIKRQNERDLKELSDYQKEIDLYFGRMNDEI